ncbi:hypothetical protein [Lactobacillus helveticus]|uniref:hypothetical protein n=1 Tax=Lactobacillus helveticus TaxID=1587 RepID=UPI001C6457AB|nr:hypothetical protein [Lactobacillus helveticus]MBW8008415.1 hypothetical protein [Lactobacillus helveticus]MBW8018725.1 hypothetical protein [Lactobacillus helveticus]MBW8043303.1 hypothetical protein [Lactobacillus helveticus]MBW8052817.1 hypothetical protein [Lactobacillus helveticus]
MERGNNEDLNKNIRTQINPEDEIEHVEKSGYRQVKDLMNTIHGYCMDYTKLSFDFIHNNKDLVKEVVKTGYKTAMVVSIAAAIVSIAKALSKNE